MVTLVPLTSDVGQVSPSKPEGVALHIRRAGKGPGTRRPPRRRSTGLGPLSVKCAMTSCASAHQVTPSLGDATTGRGDGCGTVKQTTPQAVMATVKSSGPGCAALAAARSGQRPRWPLQFPVAAVTTIHTHGGLKGRTMFPYGSGGQRSSVGLRRPNPRCGQGQSLWRLQIASSVAFVASGGPRVPRPWPPPPSARPSLSHGGRPPASLPHSSKDSRACVEPPGQHGLSHLRVRDEQPPFHLPPRLPLCHMRRYAHRTRD